MRKKVIRLFLFLVMGLILTTILADNAEARRSRRPTSPAIPEDQRPSTALPWIVGIGMGAVTVFVALKPAKRTHMD